MQITQIQTRWNDMDAFAHVNNANYSAYLEIGRVDYCAKRLQIRDLYEVPFLLARVEIDLLRPIEFGTNVEVLTCVSRIGNKSWDFTAIIRSPESQTPAFARARTVQVAYDHRTKTSHPVPDALRSILEADLAKFKATGLELEF